MTFLPPDTPLPEGALRLFPDLATADRSFSRAGAHVCARLLEDGDREDLRFLFSTAPEVAVATWFARAGGRQLSARSRAFWSIVLGLPAGPTAPRAADLWLL